MSNTVSDVKHRFFLAKSLPSSSVHSAAESISVVSKQFSHLPCRFELPYAPISQPATSLNTHLTCELLTSQGRGRWTSFKANPCPWAQGVLWRCWNPVQDISLGEAVSIGSSQEISHGGCHSEWRCPRAGAEMRFLAADTVVLVLQYADDWETLGAVSIFSCLCLWQLWLTPLQRFPYKRYVFCSSRESCSRLDYGEMLWLVIKGEIRC